MMKQNSDSIKQQIWKFKHHYKMNISEIMQDLENANPQIFKDTFLIRKDRQSEGGFFHPTSMVVKYLPDGPTVKVGYASKHSAPWFPAVIIDIIDGV